MTRIQHKSFRKVMTLLVILLASCGKEALHVTASELILRAQPSTNASEVSRIKQNEVVHVLEKLEETESIGEQTAPWFKVKTATGKTGWVFSGYLTSDSLLIKQMQECQSQDKILFSDHCLTKAMFDFLHGHSATDECGMAFVKYFPNGQCIMTGVYSEPAPGKWAFSKGEEGVIVTCKFVLLGEMQQNIIFETTKGIRQRYTPGGAVYLVTPPYSSKGCP